MGDSLAERFRRIEEKLDAIQLALKLLHPSPYVTHFPGNSICTCMMCRQPVIVTTS
jgi:hypothetical protein